ncbi:MAG: NUDIX domain-containing protein, partial [Pyrinomonadaceae bacterium]|nr:NUDIX domain-containing protein [Pyrinomonadaceae bacterium]
MNETKIPAKPRDAAAIILIKDATAENVEFCWARRSAKLNFLPNLQAFAGGKLETSDSETIVKNCGDAELSGLMACAAREMFEEIGVLLVRNGETLTKGQRASLHDDLISGIMTFGEILEHWNLWLDADDF